MFKTFEEFWKSKGLESLDGKTAEELAGLYNEFNEAIRKSLQESIEAKASKEDITSLKESLQKNQEEQLKTLNEVLKQQGLAIKKMSRQEKKDSELSFQEQLEKGLTDNLENLKKLKSGTKSEISTSEFSLETKVPGTITSANISGGNVPVEDRIEGFTIIPSRRVRLMDIMSSRNTSSSVVSWVEQANKDGAAGQTAEGVAKNQIDFDIVVDSENIKKTTAYIKVTTEMIDDIPWLMSEINNELLREILKAVEQTSYDGDGTGENHTGVVTSASAFAAGAFAGAIDNANDLDVLTVADNQIFVAQEGDAAANYILMHPTDITKLKVVKVSTTDRRYVEKLSMVGGSLIFNGLGGNVPIIPTTLVTVGDYLIGDFAKALSVTREGMKFDIGLDGNDFTENKRTILAEWRGATIVKNNDSTAFVAGTFATDTAAIETP